MKTKELKNKPRAELENLQRELRGKERDLRFKISAKQIKNVREIRELKKTIARINTLLRQKPESTNSPAIKI